MARLDHRSTRVPQSAVAGDAPTTSRTDPALAGEPRRSRLDDELREEIDQHIELRRARLVDAGVDPRQALSTARRQFGSVTGVREDTRAMWSFPAVDTIVQDLRYGFRTMRRS